MTSSSSSLRQVAEELVQTRIKGSRIGSEEPAFTHSLRVGQTLERHGFSEEVVLAGILHDIIEDSETTFDELRAAGFSERTIQLVGYCSHDKKMEGSDAQWVKLMAGLVDARDREAWAIKVADITDNLKTSHLLWPERGHFMRTVKGPLLLQLAKAYLEKEGIWQELKGELGKG